MNPITFVIVNVALIVILYGGRLKVDTGTLTKGEVIALTKLHVSNSSGAREVRKPCRVDDQIRGQVQSVLTIFYRLKRIWSKELKRFIWKVKWRWRLKT